MNPSTLFEKLSSRVPGYVGYADRERRRETDQALRRVVSQRLLDHKPALDRLIAEAARTMRFDALDPLEGIKRRLDRLADLVRHAPAGYSGLFDARVLGAEELDRLTEHDARLRDAADTLSSSVSELTLGSMPVSARAPGEGDAMRRLEKELAALESAVRLRDELLKGTA